MPKAEQILVIDPPAELKFVGPFTNVVTSELRLRNPTKRNVMYKVRTTAPMRYCVRPNSGIIGPEQEVVITLSLQPLKSDTNEKTVDKFMVMSIVAPLGALESNEDIWKNAPSGQVMDTKLKCVFVMPQMAEGEHVSKPSVTVNATPSSGDNFQVKHAGLTKEVPKPDARESLGTASDHEKPAEAKVETIPKEETPELVAELEKLRTENKKLCNEGLRLRNVSAPSPPQAEPTLAKSRVVIQNQDQGGTLDFLGPLPPIFYLIIMFVLGIVLGKFFM